METIHIIDSRSRTKHLEQLLSQNNSLINHRFVSYDQVFYQTSNQNERRLKAYQFVLENIDQYELLKGSLSYTETVFEALNFLDLLDRYQIPLSELPENTSENQEKTHLIKSLSSVVTRDYLKPKKIENELIIHPFYQELYHQKLIDQTLSSSKQPSIHLKKALNMRQEVSGLKAFIEKNSFKSIYIFVPTKDYNPIIKQHLSNVQFLNETIIEPLFLAYYYLVKAFMLSDREALLSYLSLNLNNHSSMRNFIEVINDYKIGFDEIVNGLKDKEFSSNDVLSRNVDNEKTRYQLAQQFSIKIAQSLQSINKDSIIESIFTHLASTNPASVQLKALLEENYALMKKYGILETLELILIKEKIVTNSESNIVVADYKYLIPTEADCVIYLGLNATNFPNAPKMIGLFNERYVKEIQSFPSLEERIDFHLKQISYNFNQSSQLILSYPHMDYKGKPQKLSFEIEQLAKNAKIQEWAFNESEGYTKTVTNLDSDIAQKLFLKDGYLYASVTSLEAYTTNSYKYFIERGLKIKPKDKLQLDNAVIGSLSHHVMEFLIRTKENDYVNANKEDITNLLEPHFNQLISLFEEDEAYLKLSLNRLSNNLLTSIQGFKDFEAKYQTTQTDQEQLIDREKLFNNLNIIFTGFVDRIDHIDDKFIVIDYKSSDHSISESKVRNGQQLQLPTYALHLQKSLNKKALAVAYFLLNISLERMDDFKMSSQKFEEHLSYPIINKVKPKFFEKTIYHGKNKNHLFDLEAMEVYFEKLYHYLYNQISTGVIDQMINPDQFFEFNDTQKNQETFGSIEDLYLSVDPDVILNQGGTQDEV